MHQSLLEKTIEKTAYGITIAAKAYDSVFKFPENGIREYRTGNIFDSHVFYWTSTVGWNNNASLNLTFSDTEASVDDPNDYAYGFGVCCTKD